MFVYQFGRYRFTSLPFGKVQSAEMFQQKIYKIFKDLPNAFGIADDILTGVGDAENEDHNRTLRQVMQIWHHKNLKLTKKYDFSYAQKHLSWGSYIHP